MIQIPDAPQGNHADDSLIQSWAALLAVSLGIFAITLDGSMMPVAIGSLVTEFKVQVGHVQAAMALHSLVMASFYLAAGKLGDRFGEKRVFTIGAILFGVGTVVAAVSPSIWVLLLGWSFIKPLGGAMMVPAAATLIVLNYEGPRRSAAFGIFSAFVAAAAVIGPVWMGLIANTVGWRWAFGTEWVLIVLVVYFAALVQEAKRSKQVRFDSVGALLTFLALALIVLGATLAGEFGWWQARRPFLIGETELSPFGLSGATVIMLAGLAVLLLFAFWSAFQARRGGEPLFRLRIFRNRVYSTGMLLGFMFQLAVGGLLFVLPVFLQSALQLDALQTGLVLLPYTLGIFVFALVASRLPASIPAARILQTGLLLMLGGGLWVRYTASLELDWGTLAPALFCFGAGAGMVLARMTEVALATVGSDELGEATGGDSTGKELGVAFGVSVLGLIFLALMFGGVVDAYDAYHGLPEETPEGRAQAVVELEDWASKLSDDEWAAHLERLPEPLGIAYKAIVDNAYLASYQTTLEIIIGVVAIMFVVSLLLPNPSRSAATDDGDDEV